MEQHQGCNSIGYGCSSLQASSLRNLFINDKYQMNPLPAAAATKLTAFSSLHQSPPTTTSPLSEVITYMQSAPILEFGVFSFCP